MMRVGQRERIEALSQNPIVRLLDKPKSMALPSCVRPFDAHHSSPAHLEFYPAAPKPNLHNGISLQQGVTAAQESACAHVVCSRQELKLSPTGIRSPQLQERSQPDAHFGSALVLRSEEHTSELQSLAYLVCRLLLEKKKKLQSST